MKKVLDVCVHLNERLLGLLQNFYESLGPTLDRRGPDVGEVPKSIYLNL